MADICSQGLPGSMLLIFCLLSQNAPLHIPLFSAVIHYFSVRVKLFEPASFLNPSNSMELKLGLCICSHKPINSIVLRVRFTFVYILFNCYTL